MKPIITFIITALVILNTAQAFISERSCINSTHLSISLPVEENGNLTSLDQQPLYCPYGCVDDINRYGADCLNPPQALPIEFYLIILGLSGALLFVGVTYKRWFACLVSTILFLFVAFQSLNVTIMAQAYYLPQLVALAWVASIIGTIFTLVGAVEHIRKIMRGDDEETKQ